MSKSKWSNVSGAIYGEITINFLSSGYYDPGKNYGLPENCYPPEGEDVRELASVVVEIGDKTLTLSKGLALEIFGHFLEEVDEVEIDTSPDEPDWDAIREEREIQKSHPEH